MMTANSRGKFAIRIENDPTRIGVILFPLFNMLSFCSAFVLDIRAGVLSGVIIFLYVITHRRCLKGLNNLAFMVFYFVNLVSVYAYLFNGRPIAVFLSCITYNLFPMLMYGIGRANAANERNNPVFKALLYSNIVLILVGFVIYFVPSLAVSVGMDSIVTAGISATDIGYRFGSYMGSLELGSICAISVPLLLMFDFKYKMIKPILLVVLAAALLLTMQRGAWIVGAVGMFACMVISAVLYKKGIKTIIGYMILGGILACAILFFVDHYMSAGVLEHLQIRLSGFNINSMSIGRTEQASEAFALFLKYPFGFGLGAAGNKASAYNLAVIPDGNLVRILVETGFLGMIVFIIMNARAIRKGLRHRYYYMVVIVILFLAHAIGSNVLDFYYGSFVYWYILGFLNRTDAQYAMAEKIF